MNLIHLLSQYEPELKRCFTIHGMRDRLRITQEECCELAVAISHFLRGRTTGREELLEELCDVAIMVIQAAYIIDDDKVITEMFNKKMRKCHFQAEVAKRILSTPEEQEHEVFSDQ